ncbi:hypothetical protein, partial [Moorena sp. SIO4G3]|uniref:hypothetical protein n=1 Tax=Moorena sp. SIO4G3 TaxID=2607821 RepID=UPI00142AD8AD
MEKRGKTTSITNRFPHFYDGANVESLLYQFIDVFGSLLEQGETDLLGVMRSHHVDTADNEGSDSILSSASQQLTIPAK